MLNKMRVDTLQWKYQFVLRCIHRAGVRAFIHYVNDSNTLRHTLGTILMVYYIAFYYEANFQIMSHCASFDCSFVVFCLILLPLRRISSFVAIQEFNTKFTKLALEPYHRRWQCTQFFGRCCRHCYSLVR